MKKARIGIVGGGIYGQYHLKAFSQMQRQGAIELCAIADLKQEAREAAAEAFGVIPYADFREMIDRERLDAVTVVTPDSLHTDIVVHGLNAGCHVFCEKPLATTMDDCRKILDISRNHPDLICMVDFHKRLDIYHIELERAVRAGELGTVHYGYAYMEDRIEVPRDWFKHWPVGSSPYWFIGVHFVDLIRWIMKSNASRVFATGRRELLNNLGNDFWDNISSHIVFENGANFSVDAGWTLPDGFEAIVNQGIRVIGSEGIFEIDSQDRGAGACLKGRTQQSYNLGVYFEKTSPDGSIFYGGYGIDSIIDFGTYVNHVAAGGTVRDLNGRYANAEDGLEVSKICVGVHKSAEAGGAVIELNDL